MATSHISGPSVIWGENQGSSGSNPDAGPSVDYQGSAVLDVRFPYDPGVTGRGSVKGWLDSPYIAFVDATPSAAGAAKIAAAATGVSGTAMTLVSALGVGIMPNTPILPYGAASSSGVVKAVSLDPGFTTCSATSGAATVTVASIALFARHFRPGMRHAVGAGASGTWLFATVKSVSGTTVTYDINMGATVTAAIALANGSFDNSVPTSTYITPWLNTGGTAMWDTRGGMCRGVSVTSNNAGDTGWTVTVRGYDTMCTPLTETISVTANSVAYGKKAFRYISSVTPTNTGSTTGTLSIGTSDLVGFSMRVDAWEYLSLYWAGAFLSVSTGFVAAVTTSPATATTGDVKGTIQLSAAGPTGSFATGGATNGTLRLTMYYTLPLDSLVGATTADVTPLFGITNYAG